MIALETIPTKEKILDAAVRLFSARGYSRVSMRDIAREVGIKAASIYNHFSSKSDILKSLYKYYATQRETYAPRVEDLLELAETASPAEVLAKMVYHYPPEILDKMDSIVIIAGQELCSGEGGEEFLREHLYDMTLDIVMPVLEKLIALGKIEPINVRYFTLLLTNYDISAALLNKTSMRSDLEQWQSCLSLLFSLIKCTDDSTKDSTKNTSHDERNR